MSDKPLETYLENLWTADRELQNEAYYHIMEATEEPVDWAYDVWDTVVANLNHKDNHNRAIAAQVLCNLAISDPDGRIFNDFEALMAVTRDERFVTARHALQALWKIGLAGERQKKMVVAGLTYRFEDCLPEKNHTLIRYDISQDFRNLYDALQDESLKAKSLELIETEEDTKYRKKYAGVWKGT
jgi:hypothetical protein